MSRINTAVWREFHVSRAARDRYQFDESLYATSGEVIFANFHAARLFAQKMNQKRDLVNFPEQAVRASQINALGLIHEISHHVIRWYRTTKNPHVFQELRAAFEAQIGSAAVDATLRRFADEFPPLAVYKREQTVDEYLAGSTEGVANSELLMEELLLLWLENSNPALAPFQELFDDAQIERNSAYPQITDTFTPFFSDQPLLGPGENVGGGGDTMVAGTSGRVASSGQSLLDLLLAPIRAHPHSLEAQLDYVRGQWGSVLGKMIYRVLGSIDMIHEEEKPSFLSGFDPSSASIPIPNFQHDGEPEAPENFTLDREWMPQLVMIAKNAYVWLDQLSRAYGRPIRNLAEIPDEVLDQYQRWGITGLWLIGLWERSEASKRIKQMMGKEDAVASAYSLYDYQIAQALGGEDACQNLRERAWQRGIRLASDMVPNHVGIDGRWVIERPEYFVQSSYSPFPSYSFNGPDLSTDSRVGIFLEDHYWERTDAAVVFKRVDHQRGSEAYVYHGNDGTSMAWNDTAQLNYLNPDVRETVIQTILHVARQFPIIRFDAAMTLAKKHFERLWFPEPGTGGDIASRSDFAMTKAEFDALMPQEFWREVVDRAAVEAPDTLLLAEAFWLMESYFVRTLGMHRVYNSAFMHLLRDEDNAKYRLLMKNTLEFDPEILKRYVNFMNNPDEKTAVEQFGKGDKYFGVLTIMVTMPGLPMLGHGQIEGFAEKYGMEYQRAYWDETPDGYLIERHEREVFPLLHKRYLFANVDHFLLYDFHTNDGVNENVYAFSNRQADERGLVVYNNAYGTANGWIRTSVAYMARTSASRALTQKTLGEGLDLHSGEDWYTIFRDHNADLEYIRSSNELIEQGLYLELGAYNYHVFLDFRQVQDTDYSYRDLANYLNGRGVPSVEDAIQETFLRPIHQPLRSLINAELFTTLTKLATDAGIADEPIAASDLNAALWADEVDEMLITENDLAEGVEIDSSEVDAAILNDLDEIAEANAIDAAPVAQAAHDEAPDANDEATLYADVANRLVTLCEAINGFTQHNGDTQIVVAEVLSKLDAVVALDVGTPTTGAVIKPQSLPTVWAWLFLHPLGTLNDEADFAQQSVTWIDEWLIGRVMTPVFTQLGSDDGEAARQTLLVKRLTAYQRWFELPAFDRAYGVLDTLLADPGTQQLLGVNRYQGVLYFSKDRFEELLYWMRLLLEITLHAEKPIDASAQRTAATRTLDELAQAADNSDYQVSRLLQLTKA